MLTVGTPQRTALSSSCAFMKKPPSPLMLTTGRPGWAIFTPMAMGRPDPMHPSSPELNALPGSLNTSRSKPYAGAAPASNTTAALLGSAPRSAW